MPAQWLILYTVIVHVMLRCYVMRCRQHTVAQSKCTTTRRRPCLVTMTSCHYTPARTLSPTRHAYSRHFYYRLLSDASTMATSHSSYSDWWVYTTLTLSNILTFLRYTVNLFLSVVQQPWISSTSSSNTDGFHHKFITIQSLLFLLTFWQLLLPSSE